MECLVFGRMLKSITGAVLTVMAASSVWAQQGGVAATVHNLSVSGPGEIRAVSETEICKFCHVPHNAVGVAALWGHELPVGAQYQVPEVRGQAGVRAPVPQPDGSSRLCLSCHDGTVALGKMAGKPVPIAMAGSDRLRPGRRGFIGTDLTGSHPTSFVVTDRGPDDLPSHVDMGLRPLGAIQADAEVRLDVKGKMQCTTCHDPHRDEHYQQGVVPRFWVKPTVEDVCLVCHSLR